jgi:glucosamine-6-phosphate deaminase
MSQIQELTANELKVKVHETRLQMGASAAADVAKKIRELLATQPFVTIVFAAAPSQDEFLSYLALEKDVDWSRVNAFHMDEYIGLNEKAPQSFGQFLKQRIFDKVSFHEVYYLNGAAGDVFEECQRYSNLLQHYSIDIVCMGIGENAHIAFNDPHVANFKDPLLVKVVDLDIVSRMQQVHDDCFNQIDDVPTSAITLTVPALFGAHFIYCIVPGSHKAQAVDHTLHSEVNERYPSTVLRNHANATLYLDKDSAVKL